MNDRESRSNSDDNYVEIKEEFGPLKKSKIKETPINKFKDLRAFDYFCLFEERWKTAYSEHPEKARKHYINGEKRLVRDLSQKYDQELIYAAFEVLSERGIDYHKRPIQVLPSVVRICFNEERIQNDDEIKERAHEIKETYSIYTPEDEVKVEVVKGMIDTWFDQTSDQILR
jgi:hypothetical protein